MKSNQLHPPVLREAKQTHQFNSDLSSVHFAPQLDCGLEDLNLNLNEECLKIVDFVLFVGSIEGRVAALIKLAIFLSIYKTPQE